MQLLVVEDNRPDVLLLKQAMAAVCDGCVFEVAQDGEAAIDLLLKLAADPESRLPDLIVLDLNLPRRSGEEVLNLIRGNPAFRGIPIMVWSSSPPDLIDKTGLKADRYIVKPSNLDEFLAIGAEILKMVKSKGASG